MENMDSTKMSADSLVEDTPNALEFICPNCLPKPKSFIGSTVRSPCMLSGDYLENLKLG